MRIRLIIAACAALVVAGSAAQPAAAADLQKAIDFSGPQSLRSDDGPNDYRLWGNRDYAARSGTRWIKLWVSWYDLQQDHQPTSQPASWAQLDKSPNLTRLDAQVRAANADGVHVLLALYQAFPTWASEATGPDPLSSKPAIQKLPVDLSPSGPWGWFVGYLSNRYDGSSVLAGKVDALEVVNEPNYLYWPEDGIAERTATMMRTAAQLSYLYGRQAIVGPATSDYPDPGGARPGVSVDWKTFTTAVLDALAGWQPQVPVHWSQHNYRDVKYEDPPETSRAKQTIDMLTAAGWPDPELWLTEGGLNLGTQWSDPATRDAQAAKIEKNFEAMRSLPEVALWSQHGMNDVAGNDFKSGLRDDFDTAAAAPGAARPAWLTWMSLDGRRPVDEPVASASGAGGTPITEPPADQPPTAGPEATAPPPDGASSATAPPASNAAPLGNAVTPALDALAGSDVVAALGGAAQRPRTCTLVAPTSFRRIRVSTTGSFALPGARVNAGDRRCSATVSVAGRGIHVKKQLTVARASRHGLRVAVPRRLVPARVTITVVVSSRARSWQTQIVR